MESEKEGCTRAHYWLASGWRVYREFHKAFQVPLSHTPWEFLSRSANLSRYSNHFHFLFLSKQQHQEGRESKCVEKRAMRRRRGGRWRRAVIIERKIRNNRIRRRRRWTVVTVTRRRIIIVSAAAYFVGWRRRRWRGVSIRMRGWRRRIIVWTSATSTTGGSRWRRTTGGGWRWWRRRWWWWRWKLVTGVITRSTHCALDLFLWVCFEVVICYC